MSVLGFLSVFSKCGTLSHVIMVVNLVFARWRECFRVSLGFLQVWHFIAFALSVSLSLALSLVLSFIFFHSLTVCSVVVSIVVTAYDFESGRPGSNPEWG